MWHVTVKRHQYLYLLDYFPFTYFFSQYCSCRKQSSKSVESVGRKNEESMHSGKFRPFWIRTMVPTCLLHDPLAWDWRLSIGSWNVDKGSDQIPRRCPTTTCSHLQTYKDIHLSYEIGWSGGEVRILAEARLGKRAPRPNVSNPFHVRFRCAQGLGLVRSHTLANWHASRMNGCECKCAYSRCVCYKIVDPRKVCWRSARVLAHLRMHACMHGGQTDRKKHQSSNQPVPDPSVTTDSNEGQIRYSTHKR